MRVLALQNTQLIIIFLAILGNILVFADENENSILLQECGEGSFVDSTGNCVLCKCSHEGTVLNSNGFPKCDKQTGACECRENVVGKGCGKCAENHWNFYHGCKPCNCDSAGSEDCSCDVISGQCQCKSGFTGQQCHKNPFFQFDKGARLNCNTCGCNKSGSKSMKCNEEGVCDCLSNFQGNKCDRCSFNRYNASQGCVECGACYNLVQNGLHNVTLKLDDLKMTLQNSNTSVTEIPISEFLLKLNAVKVRVDDIYYVMENYTKNDINSIELDFSDLYEKLIGYKQTENDTKIIEASNTFMGSAEDMLNMIENITQVAEVQIQNIMQSLEDATNKTKLLLNLKYNETTSNLEQIGDVARAALNKSKQMEEMDLPSLKEEALKLYELANKTFDVVELHKTLEEKNNTKIGDILNNTGIYIEKISKDTKEALDLASKALEAAEILAAEIEKFKIGSARLNTTKLNGTDIEEMDTLSGDELEFIKSKIEKFVHESYRIGEILGEVMEFGNEVIRVGDRDSLGRNNLTALLVKAKESLELGQNAIANIENISLDGINLLQTLADFPTHYANSSTEASLAREKLPEIEKKVEVVEMNVTKTEAVVKEASDAAASIKSNAKEIMDSIPQLNRTIANVTLQLTNYNNTSVELNGNVTTNANMIEKLENLQEQITEADNTFEEVEMGSSEIYETQKNNYDYLAELAKEKAMIESELNEALREQRELLDKYKQDVSLLEAEVLNMKLVQEALPDGCFKSYNLEPKSSKP